MQDDKFHHEQEALAVNSPSDSQEALINWYPGHMHKARNQLKKVADKVDIVLELLDARVPKSSRNHYLPSVIKAKPRIVLLTKSDLADAEQTRLWLQNLKNDCDAKNTIATFAIDNKNLKSLKPLQKKLEEIAKTKQLKKITSLVVGVPNIGKSSLINNLAGRKVAQTANEPGVTKGQNFIKINEHLNILDTPGILWGKLQDKKSSELLAINSIIKDTRFDDLEICLSALAILKTQNPQLLTGLGLDLQASPADILQAFARKTGCVRKGGELDLARASVLFLNSLRAAKYGKVTWEDANS